MSSAARRLLAVLAVSGALAAGCGSGSDDGEAAGVPSVVATTSILGDLVRNVVGDAAEVRVVVPAGADPHDFQPSAQEVAALRDADALVANGGGFEEGLDDVVASAEDDGVPTFTALDFVEPIAAGGEPADGHEAGHDHEGEDPHFFTDPVQAGEVVRALGPFLAGALDGVDAAALEQRAAAYADELQGPLLEDVERILASVPTDRRVLVTGHDVLAHFARRFGFEVVGAVIPTTSTADGGSAGDLSRLAARIRDVGVPAIFVDESAPAGLARTLADEVGGDVDVVRLFTESLGETGSGAETYADMLRTNARRIAGALGEGGS